MYDDDDFPTCKKTYATLRIYREGLNPAEISRRLTLAASKSQEKGDSLGPNRTARIGGWFLSSEDHVQSNDVRRHVAWVLDELTAREDELLRLQDEGYTMDVSCYWLSSSGHGGPALDPGSMARLASLRLEIWFDVYFLGHHS